jgi:hypothetical protein
VPSKWRARRIIKASESSRTAPPSVAALMCLFGRPQPQFRDKNRHGTGKCQSKSTRQKSETPGSPHHHAPSGTLEHPPQLLAGDRARLSNGRGVSEAPWVSRALTDSRLANASSTAPQPHGRSRLTVDGFALRCTRMPAWEPPPPSCSCAASTASKAAASAATAAASFCARPAETPQWPCQDR